MKKLSHEEFLARTAERPFTALQEYNTSMRKILFECHIDKHQWLARPHDILRGKGCPVCGRIKCAKNRRRPNRVLETHETWVLFDASTKAHPNATSKMDKGDFEQIKNRIYLGAIGYPATNLNGNQPILIHRVLFPHFKETDHINRDRTDNRRCNLREVTRQQNVMNRSLGSNNTSGVTGVCFCKKNNKWHSRIEINGKNIHLGYFKDIALATLARKDAEKKWFGEYAPVI